MSVQQRDDEPQQLTLEEVYNMYHEPTTNPRGVGGNDQSNQGCRDV